MSEFWDILNTVKKLLPTLIPLRGKQLVPIKAEVSDNQDPENRRRIKVLDPLVGNNYESEWIEPQRTTRSSDPMLPVVGQTVILTYLNGNVDEPLYTIYYNEPNPSRPKLDAVNDHWDDVDGNHDEHIGGDQKLSVQGARERLVWGTEDVEVKEDRRKTVGGSEDSRVENDYNLSVGKELELRNDSSATITLTQGGKEIHSLPISGGLYVDIGPHRIVEIDLANNKLKLFSPVNIEIQAPNVTFNTSGKVKIGNKDVCVVGGHDDDGDDFVSSGQ